MRRGTTPTHIFTLPFDLSVAQKIEITYAQRGYTVLKKTATECQIEGNTVTISLTQEDTFAFKCGDNVEIQVRVLTEDGVAMASDIITVSVDRCLSNEVL